MMMNKNSYWYQQLKVETEHFETMFTFPVNLLECSDADITEYHQYLQRHMATVMNFQDFVELRNQSTS